MIRGDKRPFAELLAPAGSFDSAKAAVNAGADAIYMGGPLFSARAYAESSADGQKEKADADLQPDMLMQAIEYAHLRGVKVYMTLNTLMKEREFDGLYEYLLPYVRAGLDAVIVQDLGVFHFVRTHFPGLPIHASTQMTVTGPRYARLLKAAGASRIVTARELTLAEIRTIHEALDIEIEAFVHGALCYSYSGQCLMSSCIGGRSGNRGRCAGPCRLPYEVLDGDGRQLNRADERYVLSLKDNYLLPRLPEMLDAGVMSLKIEGRMKPPLYVAAVTSVYRKYLDRIYAGECYQVEAEDLRLLREVFDRGGTTDGYLSGHNGREMLALTEKPARRIPDEGLLQAVRRAYLETERKVEIEGETELFAGERPRIRFWLKEQPEIAAECTGDAVLAEASGRAASEEEVRGRLSKLGNTDFVLKELRIRLGENVFLPIRTLNELRRQAADELRRQILAGVGGNGRTA